MRGSSGPSKRSERFHSTCSAPVRVVATGETLPWHSCRVGGMRPEDVYALTGVSDPRVRPGGEEVAYVVWSIDREANEYQQSIWLVRADGSEPPRRLTTGKNDAQPRWSPDGRRLAFVSKRGEGDKKPGQLFVMPLAGGEALRLTDLKEDVAEPAWSPDGTRIAFAARVRDPEYQSEQDETEDADDKRRPPRRFKRLRFKLDSVGWIGDRHKHIYVVPADGSAEAKQLTEGDYEDADPAWTPDGTRIAFSSARGDDWDIEPSGDVYIVSAEGGEPERLTPGGEYHLRPAFSGDASLVA